MSGHRINIGAAYWKRQREKRARTGMLKMVSGDFLAAQDEQAKLQTLVDDLAGLLARAPELDAPLAALDLEPSSRAWWLAAECAVNVILAHEYGQQVNRNLAEAEDEGYRPDELPLTYTREEMAVREKLKAAKEADEEAKRIAVEDAAGMNPNDFYNPDCPACLRGLRHSLAHHEHQLILNAIASDPAESEQEP